MKKLLITLTLLIGLIANAQNSSIINKMAETKSLEDIKFISDNIMSGFETKLKYYKTVKTERSPEEQYQLTVYIPVEMNPGTDKLTFDEKEQSVVVNYGQYNKGENTDLGTKGETVYYFRNVSGSYLDLIDFWLSTFYPHATKEQVLEDYKLQEYRVSKDLKYKLKKQGEVWTLSKSY